MTCEESVREGFIEVNRLESVKEFWSKPFCERCQLDTDSNSLNPP